MTGFWRKLGLVFSAGAVGGLANGIAIWVLGAAGITAALGVSIAPDLTPPWLYPRLVWGGIWGALFLLPLRGSPTKRGIILSLGPTAVQLFVVFPFKLGKGTMGLDLGLLTPFFVLFFNAIWGIAAAYFLRLAGEK